jgi:hypothetical protein
MKKKKKRAAKQVTAASPAIAQKLASAALPSITPTGTKLGWPDTIMLHEAFPAPPDKP